MNLILMILAAVAVSVLLAYIIVKFVPLKLRWLVSLLLLGATVFLGWKIYNGVMEPIKFDTAKKERYAKVIENLKTIRDAEEKYKEVYGTYTKDKAALINFIETGKLTIFETKNVQKTVNTGGGITKKISVRQVDSVGAEDVKKYFAGKDYTNMFKVPGTNKEFTIETGKVEKVTDLFVPVFEAKTDKASILEGLNKNLIKQELQAVESDQIKGENISVGSLEEVTTGGNWPPFYDKNDAVEKK